VTPDAADRPSGALARALHRPLRRAVYGMIARDVRRAFARVDLVGEVPDIDPGRSVVLYANHHSFHDGYLAWLLVERVLGRRIVTWMAEWDRFPFFAAAGALPFPPDDPQRRAATLRATVRRLRTPDFGFLYFPEGRMHPAPEGLAPFDDALTARLGRLLSDAVWMPLGLAFAFDRAPRPDARLALGPPHDGASGDLRARLEATLEVARDYSQPTRPLIDAPTPPQDRWTFGALGPFFERYV
jgi:1-acyl-sn-glycerol-3-phosphate acyltransferase